MKLPVRIILIALCAVIIAGMPFFISSPSLLHEAAEEWQDNGDGDDEGIALDFGKIFLSSAAAEEEFFFESSEMDINDDPSTLTVPDAWALPWDFSVPPVPDPDRFTENGYEDQSIRVRIETIEKFGATVHVAHVEIAHASQLRTATRDGVKSIRTDHLDKIAATNNAVIAMNGDLFVEVPEKKRFEVRMTQVVTYSYKRNRTSKVKDTLIIDKNGDFHLFIQSQGLESYVKENGGEIVNAFTFGPALVIDGEILSLKREYEWNPKGHEPRSAIGQTGPLSYVMVIVEGKGSERGVSHAELAEIMLELGCKQAFNLDGGNTAEMILIGSDAENPLMHLKGNKVANLRSHSDIIYFATAVPEEERK